MFGAMDNAYPKGILDIVVNILHMVLEGSPLIYPHSFSRVKPKLYFSKSLQLSYPLIGSPSESNPYCLSQTQIFPTMMSIAFPKVHWFQLNPLSYH